MKKLQEIKEELVEAVECELSDIKEANTDELGKVIDMIKDIQAAIYYCAAAKTMGVTKTPKITDLDAIIKDMTEYATMMAKDANPQQKAIMSQKIMEIANKIV